MKRYTEVIYWKKKEKKHVKGSEDWGRNEMEKKNEDSRSSKVCLSS